jgi:DNA-binding transcriptional regulator YiaG
VNVDQNTLIQLMLFLTFVVTKLFDVYNDRQKQNRELRQREWDKEDRERARQELAEKVATTHEKVIKKIEENTNISREAFTEANNVNVKLLRMSDQITSASSHERRVAEDSIKGLLQDTAAVVDDTHTKVENIERKLDEKP